MGRGKPQRVETICYWRSWPLLRPSKFFHLAIGAGLGWMKWLKSGEGKGLIFHAVISALYSLAKLKNLYIHYAWIPIMKKQNSNQNVKVEKIVVFVKTFDYYHQKFNFGNFFSCPVNCKRIWNWNLDRNLIMDLL